MAALPEVCWGIGGLLRKPEGRGRHGTFQLLVMPLLTYLCHGTTVGMWTGRPASGRGERWLSASLLVIAGLFVMLPHNVAKMLNPAERLLLPAACLAAAGLAGAPAGALSRAHRRNWMRYALYGLLGAQW